MQPDRNIAGSIKGIGWIMTEEYKENHSDKILRCSSFADNNT
jgi:hypothetical protein